MKLPSQARVLMRQILRTKEVEKRAALNKFSINHFLHWKSIFMQKCFWCIDVREYIDDEWRDMPALFWLSSYVASHHLAVSPQSGAKDQFYFTVYNITLNSNCEAQWVSKKLKKLMYGWIECDFFLFKEKICSKVSKLN